MGSVRMNVRLWQGWTGESGIGRSTCQDSQLSLDGTTEPCRYGFFDQAMKARQESRLSLLPAKPFKSVPKLPKTKPKSLSQPSAGPSTSQAEEAPNLPLSIVEKLSADAVVRAKVKEKERVSKWERMLRVGERDGGMNVSRWTWEQDRKGQKVNNHLVFSHCQERTIDMLPRLLAAGAGVQGHS